MNKETIKELIIHNMPQYPINKGYLTNLYGNGVTRALKELEDEGKVVRVKRGVYSLSDELLDEKTLQASDVSLLEDEKTKPLLATESLRLIVSAYISQFSVSALLRKNLGELLKECDYYTTTVTGNRDDELDAEIEKLCHVLRSYRLTEEGERIVSSIL